MLIKIDEPMPPERFPGDLKILWIRMAAMGLMGEPATLELAAYVRYLRWMERHSELVRISERRVELYWRKKDAEARMAGVRTKVAVSGTVAGVEITEAYVLSGGASSGAGDVPESGIAQSGQSAEGDAK